MNLLGALTTFLLTLNAFDVTSLATQPMPQKTRKKSLSSTMSSMAYLRRSNQEEALCLVPFANLPRVDERSDLLLALILSFSKYLSSGPLGRLRSVVRKTLGKGDSRTSE